VADEAVDDPASLLRADPVRGGGARLIEGARPNRPRDLVELCAVKRRFGKARLQDLLQMPADPLALAIRVGGEIDRVGALRRLSQVLDGALLAGQDLVRRGVAVRPVHRDALLLEVADVAVARYDGEVPAEELSERCGFRG